MSKKKKKPSMGRKLLFLLLGFVVLVAFAFAAMWGVASYKLSATVEQNVSALPESDDIERGEYLVKSVFGCEDCHGKDLGGSAPVDAQPMGTFYAPNLTAGAGGLPDDYSNEDWARALRHGVAKNGHRLFLMPCEDYQRFSDEDLAAIVAYVRSVPNVDRENKEISLGPIGMLVVATGKMQFSFEKIDHDYTPKDVEPDNTKEWGEVMIGACTGCHGPELEGGKIPGGDPGWPEASNLRNTDDGLAGWTLEDFARAMREGKSKNDADIRDPMPWKAYAGMTDDDIEALWLFLQDQK